MIEPTDEMVQAFGRACDRSDSFVEIENHTIREGLAAVLAIVERDYPVGRVQIDPRNQGRERYAAHAAPESIAAYLARARRAQRVAEREVEWLSALLERRTAERDAGTWP